MFFFVLRSGEGFRICGGLCTIGIDTYGDYGLSGVSAATTGDLRGPNNSF